MDQNQFGSIITRYEEAQFTVNRQVSAIIRSIVPEEITADQYLMIRYIHRHGRVTSSELAEIFCVAKSSITAIITRLFDKDLIRREPDEKDRRVTYLALTPRGSEIAVYIMAKIQERLSDFIGLFEEEEARVFVESYEKLAKLLSVHEERGGKQA
ncbi:MarR family transcriptional regulator [Paenibacillus sp. 598K]|uniref:MarR family winged helix-turn-helix transcriptional regulator n=1 Tax=Paenibacillus sp. 598K TaxID=1117987 RepID=UPI000FFA3823|nr:MarR family transcriptional regulator [Paenibacillus sp. 598K]GBF76324.1 MarR family transcriptional regulator [Paenibacillus sp. 598K]